MNCYTECQCGGDGYVERGPAGATYSYPCYSWDCRNPDCRCKRGGKETEAKENDAPGATCPDCADLRRKLEQAERECDQAWTLYNDSETHVYEQAAKNERLRAALQWISGYWLGPTAVCQVHVDHMKGIARRALGEPYV